MKSYSNNTVVNPNPFGTTGENELAAFEESIGTKLPIEYRTYLLEFNGGDFEKDCFEKAGKAEGRVHSIYGVHSGPKYARLTDRWRLAEYFDIGEAARGVEDYLVFASTETGDLLLIGLHDGAIHFLDHQAVVDDPDQGPIIEPVPIAKSFDEFVDRLVSD